MIITFSVESLGRNSENGNEGWLGWPAIMLKRRPIKATTNTSAIAVKAESGNKYQIALVLVSGMPLRSRSNRLKLLLRSFRLRLLLRSFMI